ncbi:MAG: hypothetical protein ACI9NY_001181 [Kiritimatiellia bacterium]|jgi:hypothetical protein
MSEQATEEKKPQPAPMAIGSLNQLVIEIPGIAFMYQFDIDAPNAKNDEIILEHNESDWKEIIKVADLEEVDVDWVELFFTNPPESGTYNLVQDPKDGEDPFYIFWDIAYSDFAELSPEVEEMALIPDEEEEEEEDDGGEEEANDSGAEASNSQP